MATKATCTSGAIACVGLLMSAHMVFAEIRPVRDVQQALAGQGFDAGAPDGIWGSKSIAALQAFQRAHGLTPSGIVTQDSLKALFPASSDFQPVTVPANVASTPDVNPPNVNSAVVSPKPLPFSAPPAPSRTTVSDEKTSGRNGSSQGGYIVIIGLFVASFLFLRGRSKKSDTQKAPSKSKGTETNTKSRRGALR
ncbi:peptidoglycan-binding protein (plasmid) [Sinorhizobium sp. B11]